MRGWARALALGLVAGVVVASLALLRTIRRALVSHPLGGAVAPYGYVEYVPALPGPRPLVIVLHGAGSAGDGSDPSTLVDRLPPLRELALTRTFGFASKLADAGAVVVAPQSPGRWDTEQLDAFVDYVLRTHSVDPARVYLTGVSMGGGGAFRYAAAHPERLAAVMPICGAAVGSAELVKRLDTLPVRAFHAWDDSVVPNYWSATWVAAIAARRGADAKNPMLSYPVGTDATATLEGKGLVWRPGTSAEPEQALTLTEYARGDHRIWARVWGDPASWRWLFAQRRVPPAASPR